MKRKRTYLLNRLWDLQNTYRHINKGHIQKLSEEFMLPPTDIEGVIDFYHFFSRSDTGKFTIYLNNSILSWFNGYEAVKNAFEKETGAKLGDTDPSGTFGLFETSCIGLSDQEPAALINFFPFTNLTPEKVAKIIDALKCGEPPESLSDPIKENIRYLPKGDKSFIFKGFEPGKALIKLKDMSPEDVISEITKSGLTGRSGAFFPTGLKWKLCRNAKGKQKHIVCNADEGEPGSFKDRALLNLCPEMMVEGMIIAGYAVGASQGIIYLRAEYLWLLSKIETAIKFYHKKGFLGNRTAHNQAKFTIKIQIGAGAYICGEETSLLESLEGKRGEPRLKTVFPTDKGFLGKPTVVNNVETLCAASRIVEMGALTMKKLGTAQSKGTKLLSVAGDCKYPGIYEIEWGMTIKELLKICVAEDPFLLQMGGPAGSIISIQEQNHVISCENIRCEGSVMIFNKTRDLLVILRNFAMFFSHESCGLCTPCRAGNPMLLKMIERLMSGNANKGFLNEMLNLSQIIKYNSRCGLGATAPNSIIQSITKLPELMQDKLMDEPLINPKFDLKQATHDYNELTHEK